MFDFKGVILKARQQFLPTTNGAPGDEKIGTDNEPGNGRAYSESNNSQGLFEGGKSSSEPSINSGKSERRSSCRVVSFDKNGKGTSTPIKIRSYSNATKKPQTITCSISPQQTNSNTIPNSEMAPKQEKIFSLKSPEIRREQLSFELKEEQNFQKVLFNGNGAIEYFNGVKYSGDIADNLPHGKGTITFSNGTIYIGELKYGQPHGLGKIIYKDGRELNFLTFENGLCAKIEEGTDNSAAEIKKGKITYPNGDVYEGQIISNSIHRNIPHGQGNMILAGGLICSCKFSYGKIVDKSTNSIIYNEVEINKNVTKGTLVSACGEFTYKSGIKVSKKNIADEAEIVFSKNENYCGKVDPASNLPNGEGKMIFGGQETQDGVFENGIFLKGKITLQNAEISESEFANGQLVKGKIILPDGLIYEGTFRNGKLFNGKVSCESDSKKLSVEFNDEKPSDNFRIVIPNTFYYRGKVDHNGIPDGQGEAGYVNNVFYKGNFKDGLPNGQGTMWFSDDQTHYGNFENGKLHGQGKVTFPDETTHEGNFENGKLHGQGKVTFPDETTHEGNFENGKPKISIFKRLILYLFRREKYNLLNAKVFVNEPSKIVKDALSIPHFQILNETALKFFLKPITTNYGKLLEVRKKIFADEIPNLSQYFYYEEIQNAFSGGKTIKIHNTPPFILENENTIKVTYDDKSIYEGRVNKDGERHGLGTLITPDSDENTEVFKEKQHGEFRNNKLYRGKIEYLNGDYVELKDGNLVKIKKTQPNGDCYEGPVKNNKPDGAGELRKKSGEIFNGEFRDGVFYNGMITYSTNSNQRIVKMGKIVYAKEIYSENKEKLEDKEELEYDGEVQNGLFHGHGTLIFKTQELIYEGNFSQGKMEGEFTVTYPTGKVFKGTLKDKTPWNGEATFTDQDGFKTIAIFENGQLVSRSEPPKGILSKEEGLDSKEENHSSPHLSSKKPILQNAIEETKTFVSQISKKSLELQSKLFKIPERK